MNCKKLICTVCAICICIMTDFSVFAQSSKYQIKENISEYALDSVDVILKDGNFEYNPLTGIITKYSGNEIDLKIPSEINGVIITGIGRDAFDSCKSIVSVSIPDGIKHIDARAFYCCENLVNINIPDSVTSLRYGVFKNCQSLANITIPDSVTEIGMDLFYGTEIYNNEDNWDNGVLYIGNHLIKVKENLIDEYSIRSGVITVADYAFDNCTSLKSIVIPDSVLTIGACAFENCTSLENISIPYSVENIDYMAFFGCDSINAFTVSEKNEHYSSYEGVLFNKDMTEMIVYPPNKDLDSYSIPDSVKSIADFVFYNCENLKDITMPDGISKISGGAFENCKYLTNINIPDSVTNIESLAFSGCTSLKSIAIPNKIAQINYGTFLGCTSLESIQIPDIVTKIDEEAFSGCTSLKNIVIPNNVTSIGCCAFYNCTALENVIIPDSVVSMNNNVFENCTLLKSITISNNIKMIGDSVFANCTSLENVTIPDSVTHIGRNAFNGCKSLKKIIIPESVGWIGGYTFADCCDEITIYGYAGSYAERYANEYNINFLDSRHTITMKKPTVVYNDGKITVNIEMNKIDSNNKTNIIIYAVGYAQNGSILGINGTTVDESRFEGNIDFNVSERPSYVKVIAVNADDNVSPLGKAETAEWV